MSTLNSIAGSISGTSTIADFIRNNFQGSSVTILLVSGDAFTAEVADGTGDIVQFRSAGFTFYVNARYIELFF